MGAYGRLFFSWTKTEATFYVPSNIFFLPFSWIAFSLLRRGTVIGGIGRFRWRSGTGIGHRGSYHRGLVLNR